jgi:hypothetical protein
VTAVPAEINALEQGLPALEARDVNVLVQNLFEQMMHWHFVLLATFRRYVLQTDCTVDAYPLGDMFEF